MKTLYVRLVRGEQFIDPVGTLGKALALAEFYATEEKKRLEAEVKERKERDEAEARVIAEKNAKYRDAYGKAQTKSELTSFVDKYSSYDPDGLVKDAKNKLEQLEIAAYNAYLNLYKNAKQLNELYSFIHKYRENDRDGLIAKAIEHIVALLREKNAFNGFYEAFKLTSAKEDFDAMQRTAITQEDMLNLEKIAVSLVSDGMSIFNIDVNLNGASAKTDTSTNKGVVILLPNTGTKNIEFVGNSTLSLRDDSPIKLKHGTYKVSAKYKLSYEYEQKTTETKRVFSGLIILGRKQTTSTTKRETPIDVSFTVSPPNYVSTIKIDLGKHVMAQAMSESLVSDATSGKISTSKPPAISMEIISIEPN